MWSVTEVDLLQHFDSSNTGVINNITDAVMEQGNVISFQLCLSCYDIYVLKNKIHVSKIDSESKGGKEQDV